MELAGVGMVVVLPVVGSLLILSGVFLFFLGLYNGQGMPSEQEDDASGSDPNIDAAIGYGGDHASDL
jgi:hypothetical protein